MYYTFRMNPYHLTEYFHLLFLHHLSKGVTQRFFALKGGCNLRFFFQSIRYSEDMDIDVQTVSVDTLRNNVRRILKDSAFVETLRSRNMEIVNTSEAKQTDTTQRFKISLRLTEFSRDIPTKIEFSRRGGTSGSIIEAVDAEITASHKLYPIHIFHYDRMHAIKQKIGALIGRTQPQARDIFDLFLLLGRNNSSNSQEFTKADIEKACETASNINFDDFKAQVIAFLMPEYQSYYDNKMVWSNMVDSIVAELRGGKS